MKLIDTSEIKPPKGTWRYKFCRWFNDNVNWCHGAFYDVPENSGLPLDKPDNPIYDWFYTYWLFPFKQTGCACCNTVRGLIYGFILGWLLC